MLSLLSQGPVDRPRPPADARGPAAVDQTDSMARLPGCGRQGRCDNRRHASRRWTRSTRARACTTADSEQREQQHATWQEWQDVTWPRRHMLHKDITRYAHVTWQDGI